MRRRIEDKRRKRMSAEDRRKAILETTVSFISQFGFWGFTIRDVAQAQNITEAASFTTSNPKNNSLKKPSNTPTAPTKSPLQSILALKA